MGAFLGGGRPPPGGRSARTAVTTSLSSRRVPWYEIGQVFPKETAVNPLSSARKGLLAATLATLASLAHAQAPTPDLARLVRNPIVQEPVLVYDVTGSDPGRPGALHPAGL